MKKLSKESLRKLIPIIFAAGMAIIGEIASQKQEEQIYNLERRVELLEEGKRD